MYIKLDETLTNDPLEVNFREYKTEGVDLGPKLTWTKRVGMSFSDRYLVIDCKLPSDAAAGEKPEMKSMLFDATTGEALGLDDDDDATPVRSHGELPEYLQKMKRAPWDFVTPIRPTKKPKKTPKKAPKTVA